MSHSVILIKTPPIWVDGVFDQSNSSEIIYWPHLAELKWNKLPSIFHCYSWLENNVRELLQISTTVSSTALKTRFCHFDNITLQIEMFWMYLSNLIIATLSCRLIYCIYLEYAWYEGINVIWIHFQQRKKRNFIRRWSFWLQPIHCDWLRVLMKLSLCTRPWEFKEGKSNHFSAFYGDLKKRTNTPPCFRRQNVNKLEWGITISCVLFAQLCVSHSRI